MGDLECGFEEMQGVRLGYLLIKGKQMFALSQVFTELLKNIPRTTVHKRMDHLNVKKHQCDLEELRKLKAINSIAFHAAKCTLISREDVEALYFSCKTERVLKSNKRKAKAASSPGDEDAPPGLLRADAELWKQKVWFSLHGVPEGLTLRSKPGRRRELSPCLSDPKLPQFYHKSRGRDHRSATKSSHKHYRNYETAKTPGHRVTLSQSHAFFRSAVRGQPVLLQSAIAAQPRRSRSDLHRRRRRREGGGGGGARHWSRSRHAHHHVPPVLLVQPKASGTHGTSFGAFHFSPDFYLDPRPLHHHHHHHHHHREPSFPESYSSDTESSTSDRQDHDSDFGSGYSTTSNSASSEEEEEEEEEDEDDTQSESTEVSSDEESSSHSDSSSGSSRVSVQSIRFRRARVGSLPKTLNTSKAPLLLQPTFHYKYQQERQQGGPGLATGQNTREFTCSETRNDPGKSKFTSGLLRESFFTEHKQDKAHGADPVAELGSSRKACPPSRRTPGCPTVCPPGLKAKGERDRVSRGVDRKEARAASLRLPCPLKKIKIEAEESSVTAAPQLENGRTTRTPPFSLNALKLKVEESCDECEPQSQAAAVKSDTTDHQYPCSDPCKSADSSPDVGPGAPCASQECKSTPDAPRVEEGATKNKTPVPGKKPRVSRTHTKQTVPRVKRAASSSSSSSSSSSHPAGCEEGSPEEPPSRRRRSSANTGAAAAKIPFSLMANFPFPPSLVVGTDGDLCPAYSLNSRRGRRPPSPSHPVWSWQPGGQILPPPPAPRTRKY